MEEQELNEKIQILEKKLLRSQKRTAVLNQKAKLLEEIVDMARRHEEDARTREGDATSLVRQLISRQRELSVMLNRSNTMVAHMYEANKMLSLEFKDVAQALPAPKKAEIEEKINKIDELFKKTGVPDAQTSDDRREGLWSTAGKMDEPTVVDAEPVVEQADGEFEAQADEEEQTELSLRLVVNEDEVPSEDESDAGNYSEDRRAKWWKRFGFGQSEG